MGNMEKTETTEVMELMKQRHSVRKYTDAPIEQDKRRVLDELAAEMNREHGLHIQILYEEPTCFNSFMAHYGKFSGVKNYIALVGKKSPDLDETLGYCGEKLVLKAQELGLNTCWVALTHGKSKAEVGSGEKLVCLISLGYGAEAGTVHKNKPLSEVCNESEHAPEWFLNGMKAALLAPTAMNQQKFFLELMDDGTVKASCKMGFYTKLDLGIVKYHFELGAGKEHFKFQ